MAGFGWFRK